jgi:hypothetical protein
MNQDKSFTDLHRLLNSKDFESEEELQEFLAGLTGKKIPSSKKENLADKERAQDLVFEARELSRQQGKRKVHQALELDPDCIEAYEYLRVQNGISPKPWIIIKKELKSAASVLEELF